MKPYYQDGQANDMAQSNHGIQLELFTIHTYAKSTLRTHRHQLLFKGEWGTHYIKINNYSEAYWKSYAMRRDNNTCGICGDDAEHVHHMKPKWDGGSNHPDNLISLCLECHIYAPDDFREWEQYVEDKRRCLICSYIHRRHLF